MRAFLPWGALLVALSARVAHADEPAPPPSPSAAPAVPGGAASSSPATNPTASAPLPPDAPPPSTPSPPSDGAAQTTDPAAPAPSAPTPKPDAERATLGGVGASCRKRRDCAGYLHCLHGTCVDEAAFQASRPKSPPPFAKLRGTFGGSLGFSAPALWGGNVGESVQAALRVGLLYERFQLRLDVSPASTAIFNVGNGTVGMFEAAASAGYLIRLSDLASWVLRFGGGGGAAFGGSPGRSVGFGEARADVIGIVIQPSDRLLVEFDAPSYRILFPAGLGAVSMMWMTNVGIDYAF